MSASELSKFGEQVREFLRGLLQVQDTAQQDQVPTQKYIVVDSTETSTGTTASLEMERDGTEVPGSLTRDVTFNGTVQFNSGRTFPLQQVISKDYANALSLQPMAQKPGTWNIVADGNPQPQLPPPGIPPPAKPYEVTFVERTIAGTSVVRLSGQIFEPNKNQRVNFAVTHDPAEFVVIAIVAGLAALICGGIVLAEAVTNECTAEAKNQCGERGVRKITLRRKYGFSWKKGGPDIGCGHDCQIECNP
jgi:hypothetical protein